MKSILLSAAAGLALIAGVTVASAQAPSPGGGGGGQQMTAPAGGGGAEGGTERRERRERRGATERQGGGQGGPTERRGGATQRQGGAEPGRAGQRGASERQGGAAPNAAPAQPQQRPGARERNRANQPAAGTNGRERGAAERRGAGRRVNITRQQRTTIRQTIISRRVAPVRNVHFAVRVGVAIPRTVVLHPLPPRIFEIVPDYQGYEFFVLPDGRIAIVDPTSYEIVAIITG